MPEPPDEEITPNLHILTFTSLFPNQVDLSHGIFVYQRAAHLSKKPGNDVIVVAPIPYFPTWLKIERWKFSTEVPFSDNVAELTVYHPRYFLLPKIFMPFHAFSMFLGSLPLLWRLNGQRKFDCIDAHFVYPDGLAAILVGKLLRVPVVVSVRGTDINVYPQFRLIRRMIQWALRRACAVIAVSGALKERVIALGISADNIEVISNGIDVDRFWRISPSEARQKLSIPGGIPMVVSVGALVDSKGQETFIRAIAGLVDKYPLLQAWILGEGHLRGFLEKLACELGLKDRIHLPGKRPNEELIYWFSAANLSCLTSQREGWPNVVTESLACGTPVVATDVGGIPEILHSPQLGVIVKQNPEDVAEGIQMALSKEWNHEAISRETRMRSWKNVATEVEQTLQAAIARHKQKLRKSS